MPGFSLRVAAATWVGLLRPANEDAASVDGERVGGLRGQTLAGERHLLIVADGLGGHVAGEIASGLALAAFNERAMEINDAATACAALAEANRALYDAAALDPALSGMGTTVVGALATPAQVTWFNAGDSRAYIFTAAGALRQLSIDHAIGSALTQCLGGALAFAEVSPASGVESWRRGDRLLLCSDGLTAVLHDAQIADTLGAEPDEGRVIKALLRLTLAYGAPDNVTLVLATHAGR
jgi:protein phosphatase